MAVRTVVWFTWVIRSLAEGLVWVAEVLAILVVHNGQ